MTKMMARTPAKNINDHTIASREYSCCMRLRDFMASCLEGNRKITLTPPPEKESFGREYLSLTRNGARRMPIMTMPSMSDCRNRWIGLLLRFMNAMGLSTRNCGRCVLISIADITDKAYSKSRCGEGVRAEQDDQLGNNASFPDRKALWKLEEKDVQ